MKRIYYCRDCRYCTEVTAAKKHALVCTYTPRYLRVSETQKACQSYRSHKPNK